MKFVSFHLRKRRGSPFPKLYVAKSRSDMDELLRGVPCMMFFDKQTGPPTQWWDMVSGTTIEQTAVRDIHRKDCVDMHSVTMTVSSFVQKNLGIPFHDAWVAVPVFQRDRKWNNAGIPRALRIENDGPDGSMVPMFLFESHGYSNIPKDGPSIKLPNGEIAPTLCAACPQNIAHMSGMCSFGDEKCMTHMVVPGKSRFLANMDRYAAQMERLSEGDQILADDTDDLVPFVPPPQPPPIVTPRDLAETAALSTPAPEIKKVNKSVKKRRSLKKKGGK